MRRPPPRATRPDTLIPYTTLFRSRTNGDVQIAVAHMSKERNAPFMPDRLQPRSDFDHIGFHVADGQADVKSIERAEVLDDMLKICADIPDRCAVLFRTCQNRIIEQHLLRSERRRVGKE